MSDRDPKTGRFLPGNSGNGGRPKGARTKLGEKFLEDLFADWEEHGSQVIQDVRTDKPDQYLKVVASILPKDLNVNVNPDEDLTDEQLIERLRDLAEIVNPLLSSEGVQSAGRRVTSPPSNTKH